MTPATGFTPDDPNDSVIDELIGKLQSDPASADLLIGVLAQRIRDANEAADLKAAEHFIQTRVLSSGAAITADSASVGRDVLGNSLFDTLNFVGGAAAVNAANPRQVDLTVGGAGADCEMDYIVSPCFLTQTNYVFTEGMSFPSLSGCTFKGYSTIQGAVTNAGTLSAGDSSTILICHGTYAEKVSRTDVSGASLILRGSGQGNTIIAPGTGSGTILTIPTQLNDGNAVVISGITFDTTGMNAGAKGIACGGAQRVKVNNCAISVASSSDIGIDPGNSGVNGLQMSQVNFSGSGIGVQTAASLSVANITATLCGFEVGMAVGMHLRGQSNGSVSACHFGATIGIKFSGASTVQGMSVVGNGFYTCTTGIQHVGGNVANNNDFTWSANYFESCTTGIDLSTLTGNLSSISANDNTFLAGTTGIKLHATRVINSVIMGNSFAGYAAGSEISGMTLAQAVAANTQITHNETDSGTAIVDSGKGHWGVGANIEHHSVVAIVDGTLTTQKATVGPMPLAGTITGVTCKTCDGVTIGATAWVGTIYKVLAANRDTDGGTTEIFVVRPTITNTHMAQAYGAPDSITAFAAGDFFIFATTQIGTNATAVTMTASVTYP